MCITANGKMLFCVTRYWNRAADSGVFKDGVGGALLPTAVSAPKSAFQLVRYAGMQWLPFTAGAVAAFIVVWATCPIPPRHPYYVDSLLAFAAMHVLFSTVTCAMVTLCSFRLLSAERIQTGAALWPALTLSIWFSPLVILLWQRSLWAVLPLILVTANTARLVYGGLSLNASQAERPLVTRAPFSVAEQRSFIPLLPFLAALGLQAGLLAETVHERSAGIALTGVAAGAILWLVSRYAKDGQATLNGKSMTRRFLLLATVAILASAAGMVRFLALAGGFAEDSVAAILLKDILRSRRAVSHSSPTANSDNALADIFGRGDGYRGVVLWPEADPRPILLVPPPKLLPNVFTAGAVRPVSFTFTGVYWFFKPPDARPPEHSPRIRGNPAKMGLRSSDAYPLLMEGHQLFSSPVGLSCCSQIQVVVKNAEYDPGATFLELAVGNTSLPRQSEQLLGRKKLLSRPETAANGEAATAEETLTFDVPAAPLLHDFDEMIFRFRRDYMHAGVSSRIAIDRIVFVPR